MRDDPPMNSTEAPMMVKLALDGELPVEFSTTSMGTAGLSLKVAFTQLISAFETSCRASHVYICKWDTSSILISFSFHGKIDISPIQKLRFQFFFHQICMACTSMKHSDVLPKKIL